MIENFAMDFIIKCLLKIEEDECNKHNNGCEGCRFIIINEDDDRFCSIEHVRNNLI